MLCKKNQVMLIWSCKNDFFINIKIDGKKNNIPFRTMTKRKNKLNNQVQILTPFFNLISTIRSWETWYLMRFTSSELCKFVNCHYFISQSIIHPWLFIHQLLWFLFLCGHFILPITFYPASSSLEFLWFVLWDLKKVHWYL